MVLEGWQRFNDDTRYKLEDLTNAVASTLMER
jgi:hypothetical protein